MIDKSGIQTMTARYIRKASPANRLPVESDGNSDDAQFGFETARRNQLACSQLIAGFSSNRQTLPNGSPVVSTDRESIAFIPTRRLAAQVSHIEGD